MIVRADALATPATAFESEPPHAGYGHPAIAAGRVGAESGTGASNSPSGRRSCNRSAPAKSCSRERDACRKTKPRWPRPLEFPHAAGECARRKMWDCGKSACAGRSTTPDSWDIYRGGQELRRAPARYSIWRCSSAARRRVENHVAETGRAKSRRRSPIEPKSRGIWKRASRRTIRFRRTIAP